MIRKIFTILVISLLAGCNGGEGFKSLEDLADAIEGASIEAVEIESFTPESDPVVFQSTGNKTFAVIVNDGAGSVNYLYKLNGVEIDSKKVPFHILDSALLAPGDHELVVEASNAISKATKTFNIVKNTPPSVSLNSITSTTINCSSDSFNLSIVAFDLDGDSISYSYYLNGVQNAAAFSITAAAFSTNLSFSPSCAYAGNNTIAVRATDSNGEYSEYVVSVNVTNPNVASIVSYTPVADPVVILSTETKNFLISATGNPPLSFEWSIDPGSALTSCTTSTCSLTGGDLTPGNYVLSVELTDALNSTDDHSYNVVINDKPRITFKTPTNSTPLIMNCGVSKSFNMTIEDLNFSDGQNFSVSWYLNDQPNNSLSSSNSLMSHPMSSTATFSPNCNPLLIGDHVLKAVVSDGYETQTLEWNITVNYFSEACNNLTSGQICTITGLLGMGSGLNINSSSEVRIYPQYTIPYPAGGLFVTDTQKHVVWFVNNTSTSKTVLGKTVAANTIYALFGTGIIGIGTEGRAYNEFYLSSPQGVAYSAIEDALYVADYGNARIVRFNSSGVSTIFAGGGPNNNTTGNVDGGARTSHRCGEPLNMTLDDSERKLFVACYGNATINQGSIKYFMTNADQGYSLIKVQDVSGLANIEGTIGLAGTASTRRIYSIVKDPFSKIIYASDSEAWGQIMAISYGDSKNYYGNAVSLPANTMRRLTLNAGIGNTLNRLYSDVTGRLRAYSLAPYSSGGELKGLFLSNYHYHNISLLNLSSSDITLGGRTVASGYYNNILGNSGADYSRAKPAWSNTYIYYALGIYSDGNDLIFNDRGSVPAGNFKVSALDITVPNGNTRDIVGSIPTVGYDGESAKISNLRQLYLPKNLTYSSNSNSLVVMDSNNYRVRKLNLNSGALNSIIGAGVVGNANTEPDIPSNTFFRSMGDLQESDDGDFLFYSDFGTNNCQVRALNQTLTSVEIFEQIIPSNRVMTIAGNYVQGCAAWNNSFDGLFATTVPLRNITGITVKPDMSTTYLAAYSEHCIWKVSNTTGNVERFLGQCGTSATHYGDVDGTFLSAKLTYPTDLELDQNEDSPTNPRASGNFFIVDYGRLAGSRIKYVNNSAGTVTIFGIDIEPGEVRKILTFGNTEGYVGSVASYENQICYTQGVGVPNGHQFPSNVFCLDRDTGTTTIRIGKASASLVKAQTAHYAEQEGVLAGSATLSQPWGLAFDSEGNLYISDYANDAIRKVKRWY
jgi:hypothetical protein